MIIRLVYHEMYLLVEEIQIKQQYTINVKLVM